MISEKLQSVCDFLTSLAEEVQDEEIYAKLNIVRNELRDAAEQAEMMEQCLTVSAGQIKEEVKDLQKDLQQVKQASAKIKKLKRLLEELEHDLIRQIRLKIDNS